MIENEDLILLSIGYGEDPDWEEIGEILNLKRDSIHRHLKVLQDGGLLLKDKRGDKYELTVEGRDRYERILCEVEEMEIEPEHHGVTRYCRLKVLLPWIKRSGTIMRIVVSIQKGHELDVARAIRYEVDHDSLFFTLWLEEMKVSRDMIEITDEFFQRFTLLSGKIGINEELDRGLYLADLERRKGNVYKAKCAFQNYIDSRYGLEPGLWIVAKIGLIYCTNNLNDSDRAIKVIEETYGLTRDGGHIAWLDYIKADILSDMGRMEEASTLYKKSVRKMKRNKMRISLAEVYNSYGVHCWRMDDKVNAERHWNKCRNLCNRYGLDRMKAIAMSNLADPISLNGNFRNAHDQLRGAMKIFERIGDLEGISGVHFNRSLVHVREHKLEKALISFRKCEEFPLMYARKRNERRVEFDKCLKENGYSPYETIFKGEPPQIRNPLKPQIPNTTLKKLDES